MRREGGIVGLVECIHILVAGSREGCMTGKIDRFEFLLFFAIYQVFSA